MFSPAEDSSNAYSIPTAAQTTPERMNRHSLVRLTRIPAWNAASWPSPIAYSERPGGVIRSITPVISARNRKIATDQDTHWLPRNPTTPRLFHGAGKFETVFGPSTTSASPR